MCFQTVPRTAVSPQSHGGGDSALHAPGMRARSGAGGSQLGGTGPAGAWGAVRKNFTPEEEAEHEVGKLLQRIRGTSKSGVVAAKDAVRAPVARAAHALMASRPQLLDIVVERALTQATGRDHADGLNFSEFFRVRGAAMGAHAGGGMAGLSWLENDNCIARAGHAALRLGLCAEKRTCPDRWCRLKAR